MLALLLELSQPPQCWDYRQGLPYLVPLGFLELYVLPVLALLR